MASPSQPDESPTSPQNLVRRRRVLLYGASVCAAISAGGVAASMFIKSPEQQRAEANPPAPSVLTAPVEYRVLKSSIVTRGTVEPGKSIELTPVIAGMGAQVVTALNVEAGSEVRAGSVILAVSGRPVIALPGELPGYRDLKPGDKGGDVLQLQEALRSFGVYRAGDRQGYFGAATKDALRKLYSNLGYDVTDTGGPGGRADKPSLEAARSAVSNADLAVKEVERRISSGGTPQPDDEPLELQLERAKVQLQQAQAALNDLIAHTGPMIPLAEFVFIPQFPARVTAASARIGEPVKAPLVTLGMGDLAVKAKLRPDQAGAVRAGMTATLVSELHGGQSAPAEVTSVSEIRNDQTSNGGAPHVLTTITPSRALPVSWAGSDIRVTITSAQTDSKVLVVPLSAVSASADGRTTVSVMRGGQSIRVEIRAGVSGDGYVEVNPTQSEVLKEGDLVVVSAES